jgi:hypothetical protein
MKKVEKIIEECGEKPDFKHHCCHGGSSNAIYGLGVVGALAYFLQGTNGFGAVIIGIGKAIIWPALVIFKLLTYLHL